MQINLTLTVSPDQAQLFFKQIATILSSSPSAPDDIETRVAENLAQAQGLPVAPGTLPAQPEPVSPQASTTAPLPTTEQSYTQDQLALAAAQILDAGRQTELIQLLGNFGVQAVTQLPPEQYGAFATSLRGMGARI
jgi:hypothetical protein